MDENKKNGGEKRFQFSFHGKEIVVEVDQLATKSDKSILFHYGSTTVLSVLVTKQLTRCNDSFFPLNIIFEEKSYSIGRIPTGFSKREEKSSYEAITTSRLVDRSLRSFFPLSFADQEVQITNCILSADSTCDPRIVAIWASFLVCFLSPSLPFFQTPLAAVVVGKGKGNFICNPSNEELKHSSLDLIVSATEEKIIMLEADSQELSEGELMKAIEFAQKEILVLIGFFQSIAKSLGVKKEKLEVKAQEIEDKWLVERTNHYLEGILTSTDLSWIQKERKMKDDCQDLVEEYHAKNPQLEGEFVKDLVEQTWSISLQNLMRKLWKEKQIRLDGRKADEIRPLKIQIDPLRNVHGSAVFARGDTEVLSVVTLGKTSEKQLVDNVFARFYKHFIHHYNFPQFAVNETFKNRGISRREIGHGELVEKTFECLVPKNLEFPYTIRVVSEVLSSDGSSSQASICATSLALMTAGVPLVRPAAGIALGLFEGQVINDINGLEDKLGEMDFKIAGTEKGICSLQLDLKNEGISNELLKECLQKALHSRIYLLSEMKKSIPQTRSTLPVNVIKCRRFSVQKEKIGLVIGPRGETVNRLTRETGVTIEIQDEDVLVYHQDEKNLERVINMIKKIVLG